MGAGSSVKDSEALVWLEQALRTPSQPSAVPCLGWTGAPDSVVKQGSVWRGHSRHRLWGQHCRLDMVFWILGLGEVRIRGLREGGERPAVPAQHLRILVAAPQTPVGPLSVQLEARSCTGDIPRLPRPLTSPKDTGSSRAGWRSSQKALLHLLCRHT